MANSIHIIADLTTVINNGPSAATTSNCTVASGAILDYPGNVKLLKTKAQEMAVLIGKLVAQTDPGSDATNLGLLQNVQNDLT